jgi:hypothetical protein
MTVKKLANLTKLPETRKSRRYSLMQINGKPGLACFVEGEWIIDETCRSLNEMLDSGIVCKESISGWISQQTFMHH